MKEYIIISIDQATSMVEVTIKNEFGGTNEKWTVDGHRNLRGALEEAFADLQSAITFCTKCNDYVPENESEESMANAGICLDCWESLGF